MIPGELPIFSSKAIVVLIFLAVSGGCRSRSASHAQPPGGETVWISANGLRLKSKIYKSAVRRDNPILVIILHGDLLAPGSPPTYHYEFASMVTRQMDNIVAGALLRPGYADDDGDRSDGKQGLRSGDNYTPEVVDAISQSVHTLQSRIHPAATILMGHSGGAAITADLLGRHPNQVNAALLVSCPCNLSAWRRHMIGHEFRDVGPLSLMFLVPVKSLSPIELVGSVPPSSPVRMVVGSRDPVAPPELTQQYADALRRRGVDVAVAIAPGLEHNILLEPVILEQLQRLIETLKAESSLN